MKFTSRIFAQNLPIMRLRFTLALISLLIFSCTSVKVATAQPNSSPEKNSIKPPKLVVGIVVDQMRYDYLTRFWSRYGNGGFKRLASGFNARNNHYNYIPTYTGPGHASIFTGTTPQNHGIIGNNWFDKYTNEEVYCAGDPNVESVGTDSFYGKMSPHRMLTTTLGDQIKLHTQGRGKVVGVSIKDRGAILPAGHSANAAYWFEGGDKGDFITSDYYMTALPEWVSTFNGSSIVPDYLTTWETLYPIDTYTASGPDLNDFEASPRGKSTATFPYDLKELAVENGNLSLLRATPYGNSLLLDFAKEAIINEQLGKDDITDLFTISFSSPDYIGHQYGVNSVEVEDTYLRLDRDIERFLNFLDNEVGEGNYTVFLTADHGAVHVPSYLQSMKIPAGYISTSVMGQDLVAHLDSKFGSKSIIRAESNGQIFLDHEVTDSLKLDEREIQEAMVIFLLNREEVQNAYSRHSMRTQEYTQGQAALLQNGFNQRRSGDVLVTFKPNYISYPKTGSTHGSGQAYDTHVPLLMYGVGINSMNTFQPTKIVDITPTICAILGISPPNGATGEIIVDAIKAD